MKYFISVFLMTLFAINSMAACSTYAGNTSGPITSQISINEYNYAGGYIELKVINPAILSTTSNLNGWKLSLFQKSGANFNRTDYAVSSYLNSCTTSTSQPFYIKITTGNLGNDTIVVLWSDSAMTQEVDYFRIGQQTYPTYYASSCFIASEFPTASTSTWHQAILAGSSARKDLARGPDGTGKWIETPYTGNDQGTSCSSNDGALNISKTLTSAITTPYVGENATFRIAISLDSRLATENSVSVQDLLPNGLTYISHTASTGTYLPSSGLWSIGTLSITPATLDITTKVTKVGVITNEANVSSINFPAGTITPAQASVTVLQPLTLTKTVLPSLVSYNSSAQYVVSVKNNSSASLPSGFTINDAVPNGLIPSTPIYTAGTTYSAGVWSIPSNMPSQATYTLTLPVTTQSIPGTFINVATAVAPFFGPDLNASATLTCTSTPQAATVFDAWDNFRTISDRNISTKIVSQNFNLTIASLNNTNTALQDFNGTVCARIVNQADQNLSGWNKVLFNSAQSQSTTFTINSAIGGSDSAGVDLHWITNQNATCPLTTETNTTHASDRFAIRPASFGVSAPNAIAGVDFNLTFNAPNFTAGASNNYNETVGNTFDITIAEHNASCITGTFSTPITSGWSFSNGSRTLSTRYSEVGVLDINLSDTAKACASRYTKVDCDDANVSDGTNWTANLLPIGTAQTQITVKPHHFDLNATLSNSNNANFTYLSTDLNMSSKLDLAVTAKNGDGNTTKNYDKGCYAKSTTVTLPHSTVPSPLTKIFYHENLSAIDDNVSKGNNIFLDLNKTVFTQGTAPLTLLLNFDRSSSSPLNPFDFNLTSADINDTDAVTGNSIPSGNATFVYGRARAYDMKTDQSTAPNPIELEVYSSTAAGYVAGMPQNVLSWYRNLNHDMTSQGSVLRGGFSAGETDLAINVSSLPLDGTQNIFVTSSSNQTVHLDIPSWLWYSPSQNYAYTGDCTKHPCFNYQFFGTSVNNNGVQSGTFQGSDFTLTPAKTIIKKGVKVFR